MTLNCKRLPMYHFLEASPICNPCAMPWLATSANSSISVLTSFSTNTVMFSAGEHFMTSVSHRRLTARPWVRYALGLVESKHDWIGQL